MIKHFESSALPILAGKAQTLVESGLALTKQYAARLSKQDNYAKLMNSNILFFDTKVDDYDKNNKLFGECLAKYCMEATDYEYNLKSVVDPNVRNTAFNDRFFSIISQILTPATAATISFAWMQFAEVKDIGWGDTAQFGIESNELFVVNQAAQGISRGAIQRLYGDDVYINPTNWEISVDIDWYKVATGVFDFGSWFFKIGLSFSTHISASVYNTIKDTVNTLPAAYLANGFSDANYLRLAQRVQGASGGMTTYVFGTKSALGNVLPADSYMRVQLGEEHAKVGYLGGYKGYGLMEIDQAIVPGTVNTTAQFLVDDSYLYFMPMAANKPVKIVFEGTAVTSVESGSTTKDQTMRMTVQRRYGVGIATSYRWGILTLA